MKVKTSRFGEIDLPDESKIDFPEGIVGFKDCTSFVLFDCGEDGVFRWLQSCDREDIAFVICEARLIMPGYSIAIGQKEMSVLGAENSEELVVCLILCIPPDPQQMTANLLGPVVFNTETRKGMQLVLINPDYSTKFRVFADSAAAPGGQGEDK